MLVVGNNENNAALNNHNYYTAFNFLTYRKRCFDLAFAFYLSDNAVISATL